MAETLQEQDEEQKDQFVKDCEAVLDKHGIDQRLTVYDGPLYAQTNMHIQCPDCRERLNPRKLEYDDENGITAPATCPCGWSGRAMYRLIDLKDDQKRETAEDWRNTGSCVAADDLNVTYVPYEGTEVHET